MILYLDTSAAIKLYVEEAGTPAVMARVGAAEAVATVRVTYTEARAALARHRREGGLTPVGLRRAGALAERHGLRGYDAVQLAAALDLRAAGAPVEFLSFDSRLNRVANACSRIAHDGWVVASRGA